MNLLRSEEHLRNWLRFTPATEEGIVQLLQLVKLSPCDYFRRRLDPDYFSKRLTHRAELLKTLEEIGKTGPFWQQWKL